MDLPVPTPPVEPYASGSGAGPPSENAIDETSPPRRGKIPGQLIEMPYCPFLVHVVHEIAGCDETVIVL